jgi:hypothetical protein
MLLRNEKVARARGERVNGHTLHTAPMGSLKAATREGSAPPKT